MGLTPREFKQRFLLALFSRDEWTKRVNDVQYQTRCPFCGDTQKNYNTGHFYIRCDPDDNFPIVYNCFKCPASGVMDRETLTLLGIDDESMTSSISDVNKQSVSVKGMSYRRENEFKIYPFKVPPINRRRDKIQYVEKRLGIRFTEEMIQQSRIITSLKDFLNYNQITTLTCNKYVAKLLDENYIGFLSYGNSHILFRDVTEREKFSWVKFLIVPSSQTNNVSYSIESSVDIFTDDTIYINLSEGVLDALSICYNLGYNKENCVNMCVCGKKYNRMINRIISQGLVGSNVILNIFSDNDKDYNNKKQNDDTSIEFFRKTLSIYTYLFKEVNVYYNLAYKDCGTRKENISLKKYRI